MLRFLLVLTSLIHFSLSIDGAVGFQVDFDESGSEFRQFYEAMLTTFKEYNAALEEHIVPRDNLTYLENAFAITNQAEERFPLILEELTTGLCILEQRLFPTLGATRYNSDHYEVSVDVDGGEVHDIIARILHKYGLSSYTAEWNKKAYSPSRIVLARIPRTLSIPVLPRPSKTHSDVKVRAKISLFKCPSSWAQGGCEPVEWREFTTPCPKERCGCEKKDEVVDLL